MSEFEWEPAERSVEGLVAEFVPAAGIASWYRGFVDRSVESALYAVHQRRFSSSAKRCDVVLGDILGELLPVESARLLDVGCGNGQAVGYLAGRLPGWSLAGFDLREAAIAEARWACPEAYGFAVADLFEYETGPVDVVVASSVVYALTDDEFGLALRRFRSWLRPGGLCVLFDMFTAWEQRLEIVERSLHHPDGHLLMVRPYSQVRELAGAAGLAVLEFRPFELGEGSMPVDPHDLRSYDRAGLTMRGCFSQPYAHAVLVAV